jgi:hypothetical protein
VSGARQDCGEVKGAERAQHQKQSNQESEIADAVHPERLISGIRRRLLQEVESNQQVAAQADAFPPDKQQQVICRKNQHEHEKHEQVEVGKKPAIPRIVVHVTGGINVNQPAHTGDDEEHDHGKLVHAQRKVGLETARGNPREKRFGKGNLIGRQREKLAHRFERREKSKRRGGQRDGRDGVLRPARAKNSIGRRAKQRQQWNDPQIIENGHQSLSVSTFSTSSVPRLR